MSRTAFGTAFGMRSEQLPDQTRPDQSLYLRRSGVVVETPGTTISYVPRKARVGEPA